MSLPVAARQAVADPDVEPLEIPVRVGPPHAPWAMAHPAVAVCLFLKKNICVAIPDCAPWAMALLWRGYGGVAAERWAKAMPGRAVGHGV